MSFMPWRNASRTTGSPGTRGELGKPLARVAPPCRGHAHELAGEHHSPGAGVHQERAAAAHVPLPIALGELVADEPVGGGGVWDAQQRLGDAHEEHAFLRREVVFAQERLHAGASPSGASALLDQLAGARLDARLASGGEPRLADQLANRLAFVAKVMGQEARFGGGSGSVHPRILLWRGGGRLARGDLLADFVHVERLGLLDHLLEGACGMAPGCENTMIWSRKTMSVGIERIWKCAAISCSSSVFTLAKTMSGFFSATFSNTGANPRHGPHHGAQ
jgi:hypothetical protein